jgi:hypothetical protein
MADAIVGVTFIVMLFGPACVATFYSIRHHDEEN